MTQNQLILKALKRGRTLSPLDGLKVAGTMKLSTRCGEIERDYGVKIDKKWREENGKRFKTYRMAS